MAETRQGTDASLGLSLLFGVVAVVASLALLATSYASLLNQDEGLQVLSGISLAVALLAAGIAIAGLHAFGE